MLKVMIVDDEVLARIGVKSLISWNENDYELVGECENGKSAYEMALKCKPDIIITDVKMPIMNGIELIKALKREGALAKFIMLSSYDDFSLVKEAMKEGAEDYILKLQMEAEELLRVMNTVRCKIEEEQSIIPPTPGHLNHSQKDLTVLKAQFLKDLMFGKTYTEKEVEDQLKTYNIILPAQNLLCLVVQVEEEAHNQIVGDEMFRASLTNIISESIRNYGKGQVVYCEPDVYSMICSLDNYNHSQQMQKSLLRMTEAMKDFIKNSMNVTVSIGVSKVYRGFRFIRQAYVEAMEANSCRFSYPEGSVIMFEDIEHQETIHSNSQLDKEINELAVAFKTNNSTVIKPAFEHLIDHLKGANNLSEKYLIGNCHILIFIVNDFITHNHLSPYDLWGKEENHYFQVSQLKVLNDYIGWIEKIRDNVLLILIAENEHNTMILRAKQYVHTNIHRNISLKSISEHLGLSSGYFSRMFSKETGQRFIDYVTQEKIQLAKALIKSSNKKMYEVAEAVGYDNVYYFSRVFKKTSGISPMDFKSGKSDDVKIRQNR